jgi:hypothetical protein
MRKGEAMTDPLCRPQRPHCRLPRLFAVTCCVCAALPSQAGAVACPDPGARVAVCIRNPTASTTPQITLSGAVGGTENTCQGPPPISGSYSKSLTLMPGETRCFDGPTALPDTVKGLLSGRYVHNISVPTTGQAQAQQGTVLFSSTGNWSRVEWTYFPTVLTVANSGDSSCADGLCIGSGCTLRRAVNYANSIASATNPVLIQFSTTTPIQITQSCPLSLTAGHVTIDGTDSNGNPTIVGDKNAAVAGNQDSFPRVVDLQGTGSFSITSPANTLRGLHIKNSLSGATAQSKHLIAVSTAGATDNVVENCKIEGGNTLTCPAGAGCTNGWDLVNVGQADLALSLKNVEAHSGLDQGAEAFSGACFDVTNSWFHHNYRGGIRASSGNGLVDLEANTIELSGRRATDNAVMSATADGVSAVGNGSRVTALNNIIWLNRDNGSELSGASTDGDHLCDYVCGNGRAGFAAANPVSGCAAFRDMVDAAAVYNAQPGVYLQGCWNAGSFDLEGANAFARNDSASSCDFRNDSDSFILARSNYWGTNPPSVCGSSPTEPIPALDPVAIDLQLAAANPVAPTDALLRGQTIRLQGSGFNAIAGNPPISGSPPDCLLGDSPTQSCCLVKPALANVCGSGVHNPILGGGNCVELLDRNGVWNKLKVTAVSPGMIVTEVPQTLFPCSGGEGEIWVGKRLDEFNIKSGSSPYCVN